jgi:hypothetical protein
MSQILALFYSSALQFALMEHSGLTGSAVALAWIFFLIMFSICFGIVFWKDRNARIVEARRSTRMSRANFDDDKGNLREVAKKNRYEITLFFNRLRSVDDMLTILQTLLYKGFLYLSALTFNNAVLTSIADAATEGSQWKDFSTLKGQAYFTYAAVINFLGILVVHILDLLINRLFNKATQPTLILLHNEFIELFSYALAFLCGRAWAEAFKRTFNTGADRIWNSFAVAMTLTIIFVLLNAFLLRYTLKMHET